jgi:hypothetical protein
MPREAKLFKTSKGDIIKAYFLLRKEGKTIPGAWGKRAEESRKKREKKLAPLLKSKKLDVVPLLMEWENFYKKECFYKGLAILFELERYGKVKKL